MFDELVADTLGVHGAGAVQAWARIESAGCARRLAAMVTMLDHAHAASGSADRDQWCIDNWSAVCAHIAATQRLTSGAASSLLIVAVALHDRFPTVAALFAAGLIDYPMARTIVTRAANVTDADTLHHLDHQLAEALRTWPPMGRDTLERTIDTVITRLDPHALRRTQIRARNRCLDVVVEDGTGLAAVFGTLFLHDAHALDTRLNDLAATVCPADPRTRDQRRADAAGAMARGADRLACLCDTTDCPAADLPPSTGVVVYLIAALDTVTPPSTDGPPPDPLPDPAPDCDDPTCDTHDSELATDVELAADTAPEPPTAIVPATVPDLDECAALDGVPPASFTTPLRETTWPQAAIRRPGHLSTIPAAAMMSRGFIPGTIARRAASTATLRPVVHPGQAPPEPHYRPSRTLAEFLRCRDLTCRFPGCTEPATNCDVDHVIPWPYGPTAAANLACLCRRHHLLKTFWADDPGWGARLLTDGTLIWTAPDGQPHTTVPGSRLLFPSLSAPTAPVTASPVRASHHNGLTMPRRRTTRTQDRIRRIRRERDLNTTDCGIGQDAHPKAELLRSQRHPEPNAHSTEDDTPPSDAPF